MQILDQSLPPSTFSRPHKTQVKSCDIAHRFKSDGTASPQTDSSRSGSFAGLLCQTRAEQTTLYRKGSETFREESNICPAGAPGAVVRLEHNLRLQSLHRADSLRSIDSNDGKAILGVYTHFVKFISKPCQLHIGFLTIPSSVGDSPLFQTGFSDGFSDGVRGLTRLATHLVSWPSATIHPIAGPLHSTKTLNSLCRI